MLARADDFADALAGTPFAVHEGGPLLVTGTAKLDVRVSQEIRRVLAQDRAGLSARRPDRPLDGRRRRIIVGIGFNPVRIAGVDRFDTAMPDRAALRRTGAR